MLKPSERIKEIFENIPITTGHTVMYFRIEAILQYLDEEWSKNQPCKHEKQTELKREQLSYELQEKYDMGIVDCYQCESCGEIRVLVKSKPI